MADDDKSMHKSAGYSHRGYVVGDYKDLLESLRAEDPNYRPKEDKPSVVAQTAPPETEGIPVETKDTPVETETAPTVAVSAPVEDESAPVETQSTPVEDESTPIETESTPIEDESAPVETQSTPVEDENTPVETESTPVEAEGTPVETESAPVETKTTPVETESTLAEEAETPLSEKNESHIETNNLTTAEIPSAEQETPPSEIKQSPAESLIASNELLAAIALVLEREKVPAEEKESTAVAEKLSAAAEEFSSESTETSAAQDESATAATVAEETHLRGVSVSSGEDNFPQENLRRKDMVYFDLTMIFLLATISAVLFYLPDMDSFSIFLWASCMIFSMIASYNLGLAKGMIIAILTTLGYGGYIFYGTMVAMTITEINFSHIAWLIFLPLGSLLTGKLSGSIAAYISAKGGENQD